MRRIGAVSLVVAAGAAALAAGFAWRERARAQPAPRAPLRGETLFPLAEGDTRTFVFATRGTRSDAVLSFAVWGAGSERLADGCEYTVVATTTRSNVARDRVVSKEWLRWSEGSLLCGRRQEGVTADDIVPAQPLLRTPLGAGATWAWEGTLGNLACKTRSRVVGAEPLTVPLGEIDEAWRVDTTVESSDGRRLERSTWFAKGRGLVLERSSFVPEGRAFEASLAAIKP